MSSAPRSFSVKRGLDLPIAGQPEQRLDPARAVRQVALLARDYKGFRPRILVEEGQQVRLGQPLLQDRTSAMLTLTAPAAGTIAAINRGERRALRSIVIELSADPREPTPFEAYSPSAKDDAGHIIGLLLESGLWAALRKRPFGHIPSPDVRPRAIFVTAMDSQPLAPNLELALEGRAADLELGVAVLAKLTDGPVWFCRAPGSKLGPGAAKASIAEFSGKHPAGTVGYHIHALHPVDRTKEVWHLGAQDLARIGRLFATGTLDTDLVISLAGPMVKNPRLLRTRLGASTKELTAGELDEKGQEVRTISGSVLFGDEARDDLAFVGRYHQQLCGIAEGRRRDFLGWLGPGLDAFSVAPVFLSKLFPRRRYAFDTNTHGGLRAMVPIGLYERVLPMDLMATHLLRALAVGDTEWAEELGALELDEEDVSLCSYVCPGKYDYGSALRRVLDTLAAEQ